MSARVRSGRGRNLRRLALLIGIVAVMSGVGSATATTQTRFYGASVSPSAGVAAAVGAAAAHRCWIDNYGTRVCNYNYY